MLISLTPEIEKGLSDIAQKQGTTVELLALKTLRERFLSKKLEPLQRTTRPQYEAKTLADLLTGYIGSIDSSEFVKGGARMSQRTGEQLTDILFAKQEQARL